MLLESNTVWFAAADVDNYRLDLPELERRVKQLNLPLVLCRTKSGGAHLYLFFQQPVEAELVRTKLSEWVSALNLSNQTEIFPKQSVRANRSDVGSWINLPYQNANGPTMRYAIHNGVALELEQFLDLAEATRITRPQLEHIQITPISDDNKDPLFEAPPCLVTIFQQGGFAEGTRNDGMLAVGVYLKKRYEDNWEQYFQQYNVLFCKPPLGSDELGELASSLRKKDYFYRCKLPPIHSVCQQRACVKRLYGVGGGDGEQPLQVEALAVNGLTQYSYPGETEESLWALEMCNTRLMVTTETLLNPGYIVNKLVETGRVLPAGLSQLSKPKWHKYLEPILAKSERLDMSLRTGGASPLWESIIEVVKTARRARDQTDFMANSNVSVWQNNGSVTFAFSLVRRLINYNSRRVVSDYTLVRTLESYGATLHTLAAIPVWRLDRKEALGVEGNIPDKEAF